MAAKSGPEIEPKIEITKVGDMKKFIAEWVLDGKFLPKGFVTILYGKSHIGKTGVECYFLERIKAMGLNVALLDFENYEAIQSKLCGEGSRESSKDIDIIKCYYTDEHGIKIYVAPKRKSIIELAKKYDVICIDPLKRLIDDDYNKANVVGDFLSWLTGVAASTGCTFLGIHHVNKGTGNGDDLLSGSSEFLNVVRETLYMVKDRDSGDVILKIKKNSTGEEDLNFLLDMRVANDTLKCFGYEETDRDAEDIHNSNYQKDLRRKDKLLSPPSKIAKLILNGGEPIDHSQRWWRDDVLRIIEDNTLRTFDDQRKKHPEWFLENTEGGKAWYAPTELAFEWLKNKNNN